METSRRKKASFLDKVQAYWPVFVTMGVVIVWAIKVQTVSPATFNKTVNDLSTRVTVVEEKLPSKESMQKIHNNQAVMQSQLVTLTKSIDNVLEHVHNGG